MQGACEAHASKRLFSCACTKLLEACGNGVCSRRRVRSQENLEARAQYRTLRPVASLISAGGTKLTKLHLSEDTQNFALKAKLP